MRYSIAKVSNVYQTVREFCRENPGCASLCEARILNDLKCNVKWDLSGGLTNKEEKALERMCNWLGI